VIDQIKDNQQSKQMLRTIIDDELATTLSMQRISNRRGPTPNITEMI
jgi:hypothetical protein